jgi:hypothetical protein
MATKFMTLDSLKSEKKETVFTHYVNGCLQIAEGGIDPQNFKNVLHIGRDDVYGDVFKAYDEKENKFTIAFGTKGDEF